MIGDENMNDYEKWLRENPDKWDNIIGKMRLLVPENEVPPFVVKCMAEENEKDAKDSEDFLEYVKLMKSMGLADDEW